MAKVWSVSRNLYSRFAPEFIRKSRFIAGVKKKMPHNFWYDEEYYSNLIEPTATAAAEIIGPSIVTHLAPKTLIDVGCGSGALLDVIRRYGCTVAGLEYSDAGLAFCRKRNLAVEKFDLERDAYKSRKTFDVAVSMEVAEHLPERIADKFVDLLTGLSAVVVFTAAHPGQGGADHVNEQPAAYWIEKFNVRGFVLDQNLSDSWHQQWKAASISTWYWMNIMIFRKK